MHPPASHTPPTTYHATRPDLLALANRIQPDDRLYIRHDGQVHEFIVTDETGAFCSAPLVTPAGQGPEPRPRIPIHQLLAHCGVIYTQPPDQP